MKNPFLSNRDKIASYLITILLVVTALIFLDFFDENQACASVQPVLKDMALTLLRFQEKYYEETQTFSLSSQEINSIKYLYEDSIKKDIEPTLKYKLLVKAHETYATVNIFPERHKKYALRSYTGAIACNKNEEECTKFLCSGMTASPLPELYPISDNAGNLKFKCPPKTREDC